MKSIRTYILAIVLCPVVLMTACTQQQRINTHTMVRAQSGIPRNITLYAADGRVIQTWKTNTGIALDNGGVVFLDATGSRVIIGGTYVIEEDEQ